MRRRDETGRAPLTPPLLRGAGLRCLAGAIAATSLSAAASTAIPDVSTVTRARP
jgi:hypothetical protein